MAKKAAAVTDDATKEATKSTMAKLKMLADKQRELTDQYLSAMRSINDEIDTVLRGGPSIGVILKRLYEAYDRAWCVRYATGKADQYRFNHTIDTPALKALVKTIGVEELELRFVAYLADEDPFYRRERHPFSLFVRNVNRYVSEGGMLPLTDDAPTVADCKHAPACKSDQEHTRRKMEDMRR